MKFSRKWLLRGVIAAIGLAVAVWLCCCLEF